MKENTADNLEKIKIGDIIEYKVIFDLKKNYKKIKEEDLQELETFKVMCSYLKVWKPKFKELCVFYNSNSKSLRVTQFKQIAYGKGKEGLYKDMQNNYFEHCEPYEGKLPSIVERNLKE